MDDSTSRDATRRTATTRLAIILVVIALAGIGAFAALHPAGDPPAPVDPQEAQGRVSTALFEDRAPEAGLDFKMSFLPSEQGDDFKINFYDHGCGVAVADVDGDDDDDVYFCNQLDRNGLFVNDGTGKFKDVTARAGVGLEDRICVAGTFADADGDGDQDLYVTTTRGGNAFFKNRGDGTFEDVTKAAGLELVAHSEQPTFFDADGDRDLDLLVTNTAKWTMETFDEKARYWLGGRDIFQMLDSPIEKNVYYRNRGDATFEVATDEAGLGGVGWGGDTAVFDCDDDGDLDVFVANMFGRSALYANDGRGRFVDATDQTLGKTSWGTVGAKAFDYDGDGRLDLFVVDMHSDMWMDAGTPPERIEQSKKYDWPHGAWTRAEVARNADRSRFHERVKNQTGDVVFGNTLFRNLGGGKFEETSDRAGVETLWPWGIAAGDFDADGFVDAYLPSGMGFPYGYLRSPLFLNRGDGTFGEWTAIAGMNVPRGGPTLKADYGGGAPARSARSAALGDFDRDGRLDVVVNTFNDRPFLYMNRWPARRWAGLRLTGTKSNRDALGAVVRLTAGGRTQVRQVDPAGGYLAQSSRTLHFGLGDAASVERVEIRWPSGATQTLAKLELDRVTHVTEPAE